MPDILTEEQQDTLYKAKCPDCNGELYEGPKGGNARNVQCKQGHTFWVAPGFESKRV